jgi:YVTN family beta-propeller protein
MRIKIAKSFAVSILLASAAPFVHAQTVTATIALPNLPEQVATNPVTNRVYVAVPNFGSVPYDYLTVINGKRDTVITNIQIPPVAYAVAVDPLRNIVYVGGGLLEGGSINGSEVVAISGRTNKVIQTIPVTSTTSGNGIQGLAVNWVTGDVYAANGSDNEVDVIHKFQVTARIAVGGNAYGVAVNQMHGTVYATLADLGGVVVIDPKTNAITTTTPFGTSGAGITVDLETGNVFTTNSVSSPSIGQVGVLDHAGNLLATIPVGNTPIGIDADFGSHLVFVANSGDDNLSVINGSTNAVTTTLPISSLFVAVNPVSEKVYIAPQDAVAALTVLTEDPPSPRDE